MDQSDLVSKRIAKQVNKILESDLAVSNFRPQNIVANYSLPFELNLEALLN